MAESLAQAGGGGPLGDAVLEVGVGSLEGACRGIMEAGGRVATLVACDDSGLGADRFRLELAFLMPGQRLERLAWTLPQDDPSYPSLTPLMPALAWDEREAKDLFGILPLGHPDPRRLVLHDTWPRGYHPLRKRVPASERPPLEERHFDAFDVHGEDVYQLPVGPIHAG